MLTSDDVHYEGVVAGPSAASLAAQSRPEYPLVNTPMDNHFSMIRFIFCWTGLTCSKCMCK